MKTNSILQSAITFGMILILVSCGKEPQKADNDSAIEESAVVSPVEIQIADSTRSDTIPQNKEVHNQSSNQVITDSYDEGYLDGEAMAEEDRFAGHPGMQVGLDGDDDEEDYEEGFDDGYDE